MRKGLRAILVFFLVLCMTVALVPMTALAEEEELPRPENLRWATEKGIVEWEYDYYVDEQYGWEHHNESEIVHPGDMIWELTPNCDEMIDDYWVHVYRENGEEVPHTFDSGAFGWYEKSFSGEMCFDTLSTVIRESGTYYFTIQYGKKTENGDIIWGEEVRSDPWIYEKPSEQLSTPTGLELREGEDGTWQAVCDFDEKALGYVICWYIQKDGEDSPTLIYSGFLDYDRISIDLDWTYYKTEDGKLKLDLLTPTYLLRLGDGEYYFEVYKVSDDVTKVANSDWAVSPKMKTKPISEKVNDSLDSITSGVSDDESAKQAVERLKETEDFTKTELLTALYTDDTEDGVCSKIKKIEDNLTSVGEEVKVDGDIGLDGDVTILGAKLNAAADANNSDKKVTLNVSKPEVDVEVSQDYINVVQISFDLDNVDYEVGDELAVPVMVTMPIPDGIEPYSLVILHYHKDGRPPEHVSTMRVFKNDKWYVSFSVTSFSPFVFANELTAEVTPKSLEINAGEKGELSLSFKDPSDILDYIGFRWKSENETVASVTSTQGGMRADVTGLTAGSTTINVYGVLSNGAEVIIADSVTVNVTNSVTPGPGTDPNPGTYPGPASKPSEPSSSDITVINPANGSVTASSDSAEPGVLVTLIVTPDAGYELKALTVTNKDGKTVTLTNIGSGKYIFNMPASEVEIQAVFAKIPVALPFTDVKSGDWFRADVEYVYENGFMNGKTSTIFGPDGATTRAEAVTVLWRMAGEPRSEQTLAYTDTAEDAWYSQAVRWATSAGVAGGYGDGRFGPNDLVTREQLAAMLYRLASWQYGEAPQAEDALTFDDASKVSSWALVPMRWAVKNLIIIGIQGNLLDPQGTAVRAQLAAISSRYAKTIG